MMPFAMGDAWCEFAYNGVTRKCTLDSLVTMATTAASSRGHNIVIETFVSAAPHNAYLP
jgi:hypothetical protein